MDEAGYRELIGYLRRQLQRSGLAHIADPNNYAAEELDGEARYPGHRELVMEMLLAFHRHLSARDRSTYEIALADIGDLLSDGERPQAAVVAVDPDAASFADGTPSIISLAEAPDFSVIRDQIKALIEDIRADEAE